MNTRFTFVFLRHLHSRRQGGFVLVMAVLVGLIVLVVGATMMVRSQGDQSKVIAAKAKVSSMAAAETGLTRVQNMMSDRDLKFIALYPMSEWTTALALANNNTTVSVINTNSSLASMITKVAAARACSSSDVATQEALIKTKLANLLVAINTTPTNIDPNDPSKGKFRLVSYGYTGTMGQMPGVSAQTGNVVVQGESGDEGTSSASRLAVDIPISGAADVTAGNTVAPGLWLKKGGVNDGTTYETSSTALGNNGAKFAANVLFSDCGGNLSDSYIASVQTNRIVPVAANGTASKTDMPFPSLPLNPATVSVDLGSISANTSLPRVSDSKGTDGNYHYTLNNSANTTTATCTGKGKNKVCTQATGVIVSVAKPASGDVYIYNNIGTISSDVTLPRATDVASSDGVYRYLVSSVDSNGNSTINISNQELVNFYLQGNMTFAGSGELNHSCSGVADCSPNDFKIYGYASTGQLCLKGNTRNDGMILAPGYNLGKTGNGAWYGSLFGYSWGKIQNCGSNNGATAVTQTNNWSSLPSEFKPSSLSPKMGKFTSYKQMPVQ